MKKYLAPAGLFLILFLSCNRNSIDQQTANDDVTIQSYIASAHINATKDASGLYYDVINPGSGAAPASFSTITATYTGFVINGVYFATNATITSQLSSLIQGWQIGLPHIKAGGTIILLVPSTLGYGGAFQEDIPPNSVLIYNITLKNVSN